MEKLMSSEPKTLNDLLDSALGRPGVVQSAKAFRALRSWKECVGPILAAKSKPCRFLRGVLWVTVASPSWGQEFQMRKSELLSRLNEIGDRAFRDIRFSVGPLHSETNLQEPEASPAFADEEFVDVRLQAKRLREAANRIIATRKGAEGEAV